LAHARASEEAPGTPSPQDIEDQKMSEQRSMQDLVLLETRKVLQELFGDQFQPSMNDLEAQRQNELEQSIRDRGVVKKSNDAKKEKINQNKKRKDEAEKEDEELEDLLSDEGEEDKEEESKKEEPAKNDAKDDADSSSKTEKPAGKERTKGKWTADSPKLTDPPEDVLRDPSFNDIKVAMDLFRGGKSTNDPKTKKYLQSYVGKLSTDERQAMYAFFTAAAQILSGKKKGKEAIEPSDVGVRMTSADDEGSVERKRDTIKKVVPPTQIPAGTAAPIIVGEAADKSLIKRILLSNR
jgi:hypothetical protein